MSRVITSLMFLAVLPAVALASGARVAGMNVPGDYIKDYVGVFTYVSGVGSVGNLVWAEPGSAGDESMGAVLGNLWEGRLGTWAVNLRNSHPALGQVTDNESLNPSSAGLGSDPNFSGEAFDLIWGRKMGTGSLGLRINRTFQSVENATGTVEGNGNGGRNIWGVGAGFGFAMNPNADVELSGLFQNRSFKSPALEDDGGTAYQVAGRAMLKAGGNLMIMPVAKLHQFDLSTASVPAAPGGNTSTKLNGWQVGVAGNWTIGSDDLFVLGAQLAGNHVKSTAGANPTVEITETFYPNVFMGLETHANSWLTLRFGAQNAMLYSLKTENLLAGDPTTFKQHVFSFAAGAGAKAGSLQLDATLDNGFWNNPVSATFNNGIGATPFPRVSATYSF